MSKFDSFELEFAKIEEEYASPVGDTLTQMLAEHGAKLVIFGSGAVGNAFAAGLKGFKENILAFCDNNKIGFNNQFNVPIISPSQLKNDYSDAMVVVAVDYKYNDEIYNQVLDMGFEKNQVFQRYSGYEIYDMDLFREHVQGYKWAFEFFKDDLSKQIVLERIRAYLFYYEMTTSSKCSDQYFDDEIIHFSNGEVMVDGGCFIGDTALEFIRRMRGKFSCIYGFEPESQNFEKAVKDLSTYENVNIINKGLWDKDDVLSFDANSSSSKVDKCGSSRINLTSIDNFFSDRPIEELPTFIKLDIEGAEKEALIGSKNVIKATHPKLAICIYHKPGDIYELPKLISEYGDYNFFLRHYGGKGMCETVLYAI